MTRAVIQRRQSTILIILAMVAALIPAMAVAPPAQADPPSDLMITGVIDGPLPGGVPKAVEVYVVNDIADLSIYELGSANNGGGTDGPEFTFPSDSATAGSHLEVAYVSSTNPTAFTDFFGFAPTYETTSSAVNINGDDAIELFMNGVVVDVFGDIDTDGTGQPWEHLDGWTYRIDNTGPDGSTFQIANWTFSGPNALDGETSNATATTPFPIGTFSYVAEDLPPVVAGTDPASGDTGVAIDTDLTVTFSEDVAVGAGWFDLVCATSGSHTVVQSGGSQSYTLNPEVDLAYGEECTLTVSADQVTDLDDPLQQMEADAVIEFTTGLPACSITDLTRIHDIQGSGFYSPIQGEIVTIEGVVVGDFQTEEGLRGFFVQEDDGNVDDLPETSEGIFVYDGSSPDVDVIEGEVVQVTGKVKEQYGLTELSYVSSVEICDTGGTASASSLTPPLADIDREAVEGMLVTFPDGLVVTDMYNLHRYGEAWLGIGGVIEQPTNEYGGGTTEMENLAAENMARSILLDDGSGDSNPDPIPYLHANGTLRIGDTATDATAIMSYGYSQYRLQPIDVVFDETNPRPSGAPNVGGDLVVGSANVLNFWTTIGCGYSCRGAQTQEQLDIQTEKLVAELLGMNADVIALQEIENAPFDDEVKTNDAIIELVGAMNEAEGAEVWQWVGPVDQNMYPIVNEIIYRSDAVSPVNAPMSLADAAFDDTSPSGSILGRRPVAQTFDADGAEFTVVVNHFKSKGSSCGEPNEGDDGQGNCNLQRVAQAEAVLDWVDELKLIDPDVLVVGDLNAYMAEDPILTLETELTNLVTAFDADPYSYNFFATYAFPYVGRGSLDHAFGTDSMFDQVTDTATWHINADEPRFLDWYDPDVTAPGEFRASDHDPVLIGLALDNTPPTLELSVSPARLWPPNHKYRTVTVDVDAADDSGMVSYVLVSVTSSEADCCLGPDDLPNDIVILGDDQIDLRAERYAKEGRTYTITYQAWDPYGNETEASVIVFVPHSQRNKKM